MTDAVQWDPPDGRQMLGNVPCGRLHLHQVHTGQPKHRLICFYLLLVLYITWWIGIPSGA
jgi:hypothetical protein